MKNRRCLPVAVHDPAADRAGGMGVVYEAFDRDRAQAVALKKLLGTDATAIVRIKNEFRALADVVHPNLVRLYELIGEGDDWFFTMELIDGADFLNYLRGHRSSILEDATTEGSKSNTVTLIANTIVPSKRNGFVRLGEALGEIVSTTTPAPHPAATRRRRGRAARRRQAASRPQAVERAHHAGGARHRARLRAGHRRGRLRQEDDVRRHARLHGAGADRGAAGHGIERLLRHRRDAL